MNWKMAGIIALFAAVIGLIWWSVRKARIGTDIRTGVSNDKIKAAAQSAGIPEPVAEQISQSPDSEAAARRIGVPRVLATAIANGVVLAQKTKEEEAGCVRIWSISYDALGNELKTLVWGCPGQNSPYQGTAA